VTPLALARTLARLDAFPVAAVVRLDRSEPLAGRAVVLPSSFNPPTAAHFALLERAAATVGADTVVALLGTRNADKPLAGAPLHHRAGMLLAVARENAHLAVVATNAALLADQSAALQRAYPEASFDFVVGHDTLVRLFEPRYYEEGEMEAALERFFRSHRLLAAERGPGGREAIEQVLAGPARHWREHILTLELPAWTAAVSSTEIRFRAASGLRPRAAPAEVVRYIARHRLYRGGFR
jgi:nicotinic acid mononucleotide adenylyltransferase